MLMNISVVENYFKLLLNRKQGELGRSRDSQLKHESKQYKI